MTPKHWLIAIMLACGDDDAPRFEAGQLEQTAPLELDCRPVRRADCSAWNDRACFNVPPACALQLEP